MALWDTGNLDARLLAILLIKPQKLTRDELDKMVRSVRLVQTNRHFRTLRGGPVGGVVVELLYHKTTPPHP